MGAAGAGVAAAVVVMFGGEPARLVAVKLKGPPESSVVVFCIATNGIAGFTILVKIQFNLALARTLAAGMVRTLPARVPKVPAGLPDRAALLSEQFAPVMVKLVASVSVIVTAVPVADTTMGGALVG